MDGLLCQTKYKTQKGVDLVSPVGHSANSMGVRGYLGQRVLNN